MTAAFLGRGDVDGPAGSAQRAALFGFGVAAMLSLIMVVAATRADVDLWGHLRFGLDIVDAREIPRRDSYSFTSDREWINHEWLSEVIFALGYRSAGNAGLIAIKLACITAVVLAVVWRLRAHAVPLGAICLVVGVTLVVVLPRTTHVRPQLFSVALFAWLLALCDRAETGRIRALVATIPAIALWANLHGGWIVGVATLGAWTAGLAWTRRDMGARALGLLLIPLGAALASLANPYGSGLWKFIAETVRLGREGIVEWAPIWTNPARTVVWLAMAFAVARAASVARPSNPARVVVPALWGLASLKVNRLDAFFSLSVIILLVPGLLRTGNWWAMRVSLLPSLRIRGFIIAVACALVLLLPGGRRAFTCVEVEPARWPEPEAATLARTRKFTGRIITFFNWGEYAIWQLPPSLRVSIDGRRETIYSDRVIQGHLQLYAGTSAGLAYLESLRADYVWLPTDLPVVARLRAEGWSPLFTGPRSTVLQAQPTGGPAVDIGANPIETPSCFPGDVHIGMGAPQ